MSPIDTTVTQLLARLAAGEIHVENELFGLVYRDLRRMAQRYMRAERRDHTLQATALVHETYLRMLKGSELKLQNRSHFFAIASKAMRRVLVDHARGLNAKKRSGNKISLESAIVFSPEQCGELLALDEALKRLAALDPQQAQIIEMRFFGGLTLEAIAELLSVSVRTVKRDWSMARAWLLGELTNGQAHEDG